MGFLLSLSPSLLWAGAATSTWNSGNALWRDSGCWTPTGIPGAGNTALINNGGTVTLDISASIGTLQLGQNAGQSGTLYVLGTSTVFTVGTIYVGYAGTGTMEVSGGARVNVTTFDIAMTPTGHGGVTVSGPGSAINVTTEFIIGSQDDGVLTVSDGGKITSTGKDGILVGGKQGNAMGILNFFQATVTAPAMGVGHLSAHGTVNIFGAGTSFNINGNYNSTNDLYYFTNFFIDSSNAGTSTIYAAPSNGTGVGLGGEHHITAMGFAFQHQTNTFLLFSTARLQNFNGITDFLMTHSPNMRIATPGTGGQFVIGFDPSLMQAWDLRTEMMFIPSSDLGYNSWIKIIGTTEYRLHAVFDFETPPTPELTSAFINFLNLGVADTGGKFMIYDEEDGRLNLQFVNSAILQTGAYDVLGWGLECFNELYGNTNKVILNRLYLRDLYPRIVPEPAAWVIFWLWVGVWGVCGGKWRRILGNP